LDLAACPTPSVLGDPLNQPGPKPAGQVTPAAGNNIEAVAFFVATDEGRIDADATANAILRALEVVEGGRAPKPA